MINATAHLAFVGPLGGPEMMVIFLIVLLLFGAKRLPQLARGLGKSLGEFRRAKEEFEDEITRAEDDAKNDLYSSPPPGGPAKKED